MNVAVRVSNGKYRPLSQQNFSDDDSPLQIHPISVLSNICPEFVLYTDIIWTEKHRYMTNVSKLDSAEWLYQTGFYVDKTSEIINNNFKSETE